MTDVDSRELPAVKKILARLEPERIVRAVIGELGVQKGDLLKRSYRGLGRGLLMEMLYRHGGMNQREIGAMMGIDYSAVSVARKRFHDIQESRGDVQLLVEKVEKRISQE